MPWHRHAVGRSDRGGRPEERAGPPPQQAGGAGSGEDQHRPPGRGRRGHRPDQGGGSVAPPPGAGQRALPHAEPEHRSGRLRRHHLRRAGAARRQGSAGRRGLLVRLRRHQCARGAGVLRTAIGRYVPARPLYSPLPAVAPSAQPAAQPRRRGRLCRHAERRAGFPVAGSSHRRSGAGAGRQSHHDDRRRRLAAVPGRPAGDRRGGA
ncbi:Uncharacterised protein [Serratia marcescens]|nr:Uncharacterised protein [Serratia marcescens]CVA05802.1 Uncharacterised protein [Serratia marcescens]CVA71912.1 Uncharacterised protein [Serratia marcescens]CVB73881.1 Uncharacterised protein [Serratia marcescens]CVC66294.1 Uncharacterised protein [Serratia marcescens]